MRYLISIVALFIMMTAPALADRPMQEDTSHTGKAYNSYNQDTTQRPTGDSKGYAANRMVMMKSPDGMNANTDFSRTFQLTRGGKAMVEGGAIYIISDSGMKFPAPTGTYNTQNGMDLVAESGMLLRIENPARTVPMSHYNKNTPERADRTRNY